MRSKMKALIVILALSFASAALAQSIGGLQGLGHRLGKGGGSSGGGGVSSCVGVIDAAAGCPLPMLGS